MMTEEQSERDIVVEDEIGTPFCVTYDFDSEEDHCVTVRDRDTMEQERIAIDELDAYFAKKFEF